MRTIISALVLAFVLAMAGAGAAERYERKAATVPARPVSSDSADDFLLLHEGDHVRVSFRNDAGSDSIRFKSLSDNSRLDILHPTAGAEVYMFRKEQGWQTYPHSVAGSIVTIILRETGTNVPAVDLPGCSDVALKIEGAAILSPHHTDGSDQGRRCEVCGALLDW